MDFKETKNEKFVYYQFRVSELVRYENIFAIRNIFILFFFLVKYHLRTGIIVKETSKLQLCC